MDAQTSEFEAVAIRDDQLVSWPRVAAVAAMVAFSLPTFITGLEIAAGLSPRDTVWSLIIGSLIIFAIGAVMGAIGSKTRMSSYLLVRVAFGDIGAGVVNIAFAVSLLGWFGININLFVDGVIGLAASLGWGDWPELPVIILASLFMTVTTLVGFRAINMLATLMVPVLAIVTILLIRSALDEQSFSEILSLSGGDTLSLGEAISAIVGAIIIGAIILPDITRFIRHWSGAIYTAFLAYMVVQLVVMGAAGLAGAVSGKTDIIEIMLDLNLGLGAFLIVIAGSWVLNSLNLYSAVLGTKATFPKLKTIALTLGLGAVGIIAALLNILDSFVTFLFYLSVIFIPVAGVIMIDVLFIRPKAYVIETLDQNRAFNWPGFAAWVVGAVISLFGAEGLMPSLTTIPALDAVIAAGLVYLALSWRGREMRA